MAQIAVTGLAEVLSDHEDRIAAAQAWCVQQNIRSIDELKSRGDAAEDAFIVRTSMTSLSIVCGAPSSTPSAGSGPKHSGTGRISTRTTFMTLD